MDVVDSSVSGCYLLVVVGEPYSEVHKNKILQKLSKGLLSWDVEAIGCDLSGLENVCVNVKPGSEPENELLIQHSNETLAVEVLSNPQVSTLKQCLKNLLLATTGHKHLIYAGYCFKGSGSWILQNGTFSFSDFVEAFQDADVQKELNSHAGCTIHVHCTQEGEWTPTNVEKNPIQKLAKITLNPPDKIDSLPGSSALIQCLDSVLVTHTLEEMMTLSPLVGNIRFNRPTLYVFPGGQGDCALFGINGFNMLVDGGFNRKPCFWEFIRHLDRLDAVMVTRLCESNVCGITTMMKRKAINNIYPQIGYVFCNLSEGKSVPNDELTKEKDELLVSVLTEGHSFLENLTELKMKPHRCLREATNIDPFTLYQKVGHGTLEMYTLSPQKDSKEVKEFLQQWASCKENFSRVKTGVNFQDQELSIPLSHAMSICSLVVWRPANPEDTITRIFFPGSAPQNRIFEGLEKLKNLDVLKQHVCSHSSLHPVEKAKPKLSSKGLLTKNNAVSSLVTNGVRRSSESLGSKKDAAESKQQSIIEKITTKAPVKKDVSKSPPEPKKKETKQPPPPIKREVKEKKQMPSPKPVEVKKTTKVIESNKSAEPKTKGLKEVTNKEKTNKTIDSKVTKRKPEAPKPKHVPAPKATTKTTPKQPNVQSPKHVPKTAEPRKITTTKSIKPIEKKKESKSNEEKREASKEEKIKETEVKPQKDKHPEIIAKEQISEERPTQEIALSSENKEKDEKDTELANGSANELPPIMADTKKEDTDRDVENISVNERNISSQSSSLPTENTGNLGEGILAKKAQVTEEHFIDNSLLAETVTEDKEKIDNDIIAAQQSSADLLLATATMEGSMHEALTGNVEDFNKETYIQKEVDNLLQHSYEKETEDALVVEEEVIEEKSEKESLHDIMALGSNEGEEEDVMLKREEEISDSVTPPFKHYDEKHIMKKEIVTIQQEEIMQETHHKEHDNQYLVGNETITVHCEEAISNEPELVKEEAVSVESNKANLSVDIQSYSDDDDDVVKSPTPVAIVDYKDEESLETYKALEHREKYVEDGPENEKASKEEEHELPNDEQFDVLMLETEKPGYEEKESSSLSEEEKDEEEEEMIRHPTPPGEQNFYGKIGASDMPTNVEELDTRFMEHYLPVTRQTPDSCHEPLYEEMEDEGESDSESPIMEQPVYSNVVQADYPEFVNISGGTTPSEPQSPKSVHDSKHRLPDVSEVLRKDTPPQESDEDRFEEEQKMTLTETTSSTILQEETVEEYKADDYKEMNDKFIKEERPEVDEDTSMQTLITNKNDDLYSTQTTEEETKNASQELAVLDQSDMLLIEGSSDKILNQESDKGYDMYSDTTMEECSPSKQELSKENSKYSIDSDSLVNIQAEADHSSIQIKEKVSEEGENDSTQFMSSVNPFDSHGMDQSFHESYIETEGLSKPIISMDQSFHESYIDTGEFNESVVCKMDQSFHESYVEREETDEPTISKMDQSFHESYIETRETNEPIMSKMDQSFHESYIETTETDEPIMKKMDQSLHGSYIETGETSEPIMSKMDQSFHESYIETGETSEPIMSKMDQSFHESYIETGETSKHIISRMDQSFHESYIETGDVHESIIDKMNQSFHDNETGGANEPLVPHATHQELSYETQQEHKEREYKDDIILSNYDELHEATQSNNDRSDIKENLYFDDPEEKFRGEFDIQERKDNDYTDERIKDGTPDSYHLEKDDKYKTENYYTEEKDTDYATEKYYKEEGSYVTEKHHKEERSYTDEAMDEDYYGDNERSQFADYDCITQRTTYSYQSTDSTTDGTTTSADRKDLLYSATTNGVNLPRDINGHETDTWKDTGLSSYGTKEDTSFRNHEDGYDKSPGDYSDEEKDLYRGVNVSDPAYAHSDFKQRHYMGTTNVDDILLERKETTMEKTSFSSVSCSYSNKDYHSEHEDTVMLGEYQEHVGGLHDLQKESSTGFRLEDWNKPLGLPSPPESKTAVKSATKPSSATKSTKLDRKPKIAENGKSPAVKSSPKIEKTSKPKANNGGPSPPPVYVDLSYVPHHGDPNYCNVEFFRRIRARYYVFSGINPSKEVLNALLEAKKSWKDDSEVTIIPTYETDTLGYWMALNQDSLIENKIDVAPSASRCTVNLQDHETSCAAYRLEF